jgi:hypothetical protein
MMIFVWAICWWFAIYMSSVNNIHSCGIGCCRNANSIDLYDNATQIGTFAESLDTDRSLLTYSIACVPLLSYSIR